MTSENDLWLTALDANSQTPVSTLGELSGKALPRPSFVPGRRVADVLAQLGATAETSTEELPAAASGATVRIQMTVG